MQDATLSYLRMGGAGHPSCEGGNGVVIVVLFGQVLGWLSEAG